MATTLVEVILLLVKETVEEMATVANPQVKMNQFVNTLNVVQKVENFVNFHFDTKVDFMILALQWMIKAQNLEMLGVVHLLI